MRTGVGRIENQSFCAKEVIRQRAGALNAKVRISAAPVARRRTDTAQSRGSSALVERLVDDIDVACSEEDEVARARLAGRDLSAAGGRAASASHPEQLRILLAAGNNGADVPSSDRGSAEWELPQTGGTSTHQCSLRARGREALFDGLGSVERESPALARHHSCIRKALMKGREDAETATYNQRRINLRKDSSPASAQACPLPLVCNIRVCHGSRIKNN